MNGGNLCIKSQTVVKVVSIMSGTQLIPTAMERYMVIAYSMYFYQQKSRLVRNRNYTKRPAMAYNEEAI